MLTQIQIDEFRKNARNKGFSELQIAEEISRKIKEEAKLSINNSNNQTISNKEEQEQTTIKAPKKKNVVDSVTSFLTPRANQFTKDAIGYSELKNDLPELEKTNDALQKRSRELAIMARTETDPDKKQELLLQSRMLAEEASANIENMNRGFQEKTGIDLTKDYLDQRGSYASQVLGNVGEAASWLMPSFKVLKGTGLVAKIINSAASGAASSAIYGFTKPQDMTLEERTAEGLKAGGTGALISGTVTGVTSALASPIKKFVKENNDRIYRLFKISPSARADFRKSTGNMDFAEEILTRDGKEMAGKNYKELMEMFTEKKNLSMKAADELIENASGTIKKQAIVDKIDDMINSLAPEKGNVGQEGTVKALQDLLRSLEKNPDDLTMPVANNIKKQLQKLGDSAFSANGKATSISKAFASMSSYVKDLIEEIVPEIKDQNRTTQLYDLAKKSIEKTGDAEVNKLSNDLFQKFMQVLPSAAGVAGGIAVGSAAGNPLVGGMGGFVAGQILSGGVGVARINYFKPETQTKLIAWIGDIAKNQGIKNAEKVAKNIVDQTAKLATRQMYKGTEPEITETLSTEKTIPTGQTPPPSTTQTVQIRNKQTGEIRTVSQEELGNYGLGTDTTPTTQTNKYALPDKQQILAAMFLDIQSTGGKNLSTLNTLLTAYDKVEGTNKLSANEKAAISEATVGLNLIGEIEDAYTELQQLGITAKSGGLERVRGAIAGKVASISQEGTKGAAAAAYANSVEGFLSKIARATGEKGVLTDYDLERIHKIIPGFSDSPEVAARQFEKIKSIISSAIESKARNPLGEDTNYLNQ